MRCPVCTQTLDNGELIMVCSGCHRHLGSGGLAPNATGEFRVPTPEELAVVASGPIERPVSTNVCSWCGKLEREVKKLLGRNDVALCDECVSLAHDIMEAELGSNWRS